jgi:hypothetical protein
MEAVLLIGFLDGGRIACWRSLEPEKPFNHCRLVF